MRKTTNDELGRLSAEEYAAAPKCPVAVVLDNVRSMNNVGSFFRTCDAFAVGRLCLCGITATPPSRDIHKTALGAELTVPWTYFADTADAVVRMMLDQFRNEISALDWSYPESKGLSIYDAVSLASIVEKESSGDEQIRSQVAAVFYNRLSSSNKETFGFLQSDATTAYEVGHDPSAEEVQADTPYSTYANAGLPPTPICSPMARITV